MVPPLEMGIFTSFPVRSSGCLQKWCVKTREKRGVNKVGGFVCVPTGDVGFPLGIESVSRGQRGFGIEVEM